MSEHLLKALLELFAIIAKKGTVTEDERNNVKKFLTENLSEESAERHLKMFDNFAIDAASDGDQRIDKICQKINTEFTYPQKIVLALQLIELILADGEIADEETQVLDFVAEKIKIPAEIVAYIQSFALAKTIEEFESDKFLIVAEEDKKVSESTYFIQEDHLDGFLAVLKLSGTEMYFVKYVGNAQLNMNGIPLRKNVITLFPSGSTIKGEKSQTIFYSDVASHYKTDDSAPHISFVADNISFTFPNGHKGLHKVNIAEDTGRLVGLMGASGSGKSTLLNVLNGNESPSEGKVEINGINIHKTPEAIKGTIGYVPQDDLLIEELTVYENLFYAAKLCFDDKSLSDIEHLVSQTLSSLGLSETKHLKVGSPLDKTISGGQRKRLNIGLELLREPHVLFVDEPTSGLSSRDSENIMDLLKELSLKGKMVFVVIHQPSSDIFRMFDKLVILDVGGFQIYYGNPVEAVLYFKNQINTIDKDQAACIECGNVNPEQIFNIIETKVVNEYGKATDERKISPKKWFNLFEQQLEIPKVDNPDPLPKPELQIPNWLKQIGLFFRRDFKSKLANRQYLLINLLEAPILAILLAYIIRYYPETEKNEYLFIDNLNIPAFFFMSIIVALFMGLTVSAEEIIKDRKILKRESFLHLSRSSYLFSKIGILFLFSAIQTFTYVMIGDLILEIDGLSLTYWAILFSTACFANMLGLNISSAFNSAITIYILIPILLIPQLILSGVVVKFDNLNPQITAPDQVPLVGELMASRWAFEASMVAQFKSNEYAEPFYELDRQMAQSEYKTVYYIPRLQSKIDFLRRNLENTNTEEFSEAVTLLNREIGLELEVVGKDKFDAYHKLTPDKFDEWTANKTEAFLNTLSRFYNNFFNEANSKKEKAIYMLTSSPEKKQRFEFLRDNYYNKTVANLVKNTNDPNRIIEHEGHLIQKIYPVFMEPQPDHAFDFRTQFYAGEKYFAGYIFNTLQFNLAIIWLMSILLYAMLYYDVLRKIVNFKRPF
ncbi:ABC-type multidrug transport system, ATPase component [Marivirga sericea]|uniref:ABC-type multidrug transport system, ATPase component n=1 Tax=Marivirga sericea TaxID=1028 RepID=A0A1X7KRJ5_9BACT|nr:ATP-binding cassette domain-containing protein [Marivirga sericea]SMG44047.1 ABC-type multidrug transport system, ATPase component [Marivirga sericea]